MTCVVRDFSVRFAQSKWRTSLRPMCYSPPFRAKPRNLLSQTTMYYVYIMSNPGGTVLYTGFTSDLGERVAQHKSKLVDGFTKKYNCIKLVYFESGEDFEALLGREKQIKKWRREKKDYLIALKNPDLNDLTYLID